MRSDTRSGADRSHRPNLGAVQISVPARAARRSRSIPEPPLLDPPARPDPGSDGSGPRCCGVSAGARRSEPLLKPEPSEVKISFAAVDAAATEYICRRRDRSIRKLKKLVLVELCPVTSAWPAAGELPAVLAVIGVPAAASTHGDGLCQGECGLGVGVAGAGVRGPPADVAGVERICVVARVSVRRPPASGESGCVVAASATARVSVAVEPAATRVTFWRVGVSVEVARPVAVRTAPPAFLATVRTGPVEVAPPATEPTARWVVAVAVRTGAVEVAVPPARCTAPAEGAGVLGVRGAGAAEVDGGCVVAGRGAVAAVGGRGTCGADCAAGGVDVFRAAVGGAAGAAGVCGAAAGVEATAEVTGAAVAVAVVVAVPATAVVGVGRPSACASRAMASAVTTATITRSTFDRRRRRT
jgi:hypothetical protein